MNILLTPAVTADIIRKYNIRSEMDVVPLVAEIKKAQLKKVVEWIEQYCFKSYITDADLDAWNALLEEVKDASKLS